MLQLLILGMDIEIFGACVNNKLPGSWQDLPQHLVKYKFYLSFENAFHCRDYITEKIWSNSLRAGVVPVIWGPRKEDIEAVLPKNSYIFAEDFTTVDELFQYLNTLDQNDKKYQRYFQWHSKHWQNDFPDEVNPQRTDMHPYGFCQLCKLLHEDDQKENELGVRPSHQVSSITKWWYLNETRMCLTPRHHHEVDETRFYHMLLIADRTFNMFRYRYAYTCFFIFLLIFLIYRRWKMR